MILTRKLAVAVAAAAAAGVLGTAGVAVAVTDDTPSPTTATPQPGTSAEPDATGRQGAAERHGWHGRLRHLALTRGLHGEWVVKGKDGKPVTLVSVRGAVTAVGSASVTVQAEDGYTATFSTDGKTRVRGSDADSLSDVKVGARAAVVGVKDAGAVVARVVLVRK